jgi:hypothetical protein
VIVGAPAAACWGPVDHYLGVLAGLAGRATSAAEHLEAALVSGARLGCPALIAETRFELGKLLLDGSDSDDERGRALLSAASRTAHALDLSRIIARLDAVLDATAETAAEEPSGERSTGRVVGPPQCRLRRDGDYWTVMTPRGSVHIRDAKGMRHLATLLGLPGQPVHVFELAGAGSGGAGDLGDAGEVLDDTAKAAYRRRLTELEEAIGEAERDNDIGRTAELVAERDMLVEQLAQAVGLGGRDRRAVSVSERARVNVTRAIRSAIRKVGELDAEAGHYLDVTVVTGTHCVFEPQRAR